MLLVECTACGRRELRGVRSIERLQHTSLGIVVTVACAGCGHRNQMDTGAPRSPTCSRAS